MEKFCRLLPWLDIDIAVEWLEELTGTKIDYLRLLLLCEVTQIPAYLDCRDWQGEAVESADEDQQKARPVTGAGYCMIDNPAQFYDNDLTYVTGPARFDETGQMANACKWKFYYEESRPLIFKPSDIQALATKMNGTPEQPSLPEKPLHPSERKSVAQIIATLAAMAELDLSTPYAAIEPMRAAAAVRGLELPGSDETIVKFLKDAAARMGKS